MDPSCTRSEHNSTIQPQQKNMITLQLKKSIDHSILRRALLLLPLALVCVLPAARAVTPAPDGGYSNNNTAEGTDALFSLTSGSYNTANGAMALHSLTSGNYNTGIGAG